MKIYEIILIGVALSMDAFALTIANCTTYKKTLSKYKFFLMPVTFGAFQFLMPVIGFFLGSIFERFLSKISGFLTAGIFFFLAIKIIIDVVREKEEKQSSPAKFTFLTLLIQGIATSIDALLIGISFVGSLDFSVFLASAIIGVVTFIIVLVALFIGKNLGKILGKYASYAGIVILLFLAIKELIEAIVSLNL